MGAPAINGWDQQLAAKLGVKPTPAVIRFIHLWSQAEGGSASNNPFNTTQPGFGSMGKYNSVGVQNYATPEQGIDATVHTLQNGRYGDIINAMKKGASPVEMAQALAASPWGTGALVLKMLGQNTPVEAPQNGAGLPDVNPKQAPLKGLPNVSSAPTLQSMFDAGGPSSATVDILSKLGGVAGKTAQAAQAPIALPTAVGGRTLGAPPLVAAPLAPDVPPGQGKLSGIAATALTQLGNPYQYGGAAKLGSPTDCSGLLQASAKANGVNIGRTTYQQWKQGTPVPLNALQKGDAVFFHMGPQGPGHVGIYIGDGKIVEDPHTGSTVHISELAGRGAVGARRY